MQKFAAAVARLSVSCAAIAVAVPALAEAPAASSGNDTAEITVTAQKRPEKLQQIPVAASVLTSDVVAQQHVVDLSDINRVVPSVEIKGTFNGRVPYGIRGISTNANEGTIGLTSGVNIQVDGIPVSADSFAANTVTDVSQLEVLKGPQATLGGRTASAGVINFVTYGPTNTLHYAINATQTNDGEHHLDARVSGPIANGLTGSATAYYQYTPYPVTNIADNSTSHGKSYGGRIKLKWDITDKLDAQVMGHYALSTSSGETFVPTYFTPGAVFFAPPVGLNQAVMFPGLNIAYGNSQYNAPEHMGSRYEDADGALVLNYHLGDTTITSTTSLFHENQNQSQLVFEAANPDWASQFESFLVNVTGAPAFLNQPFVPVQTAFGHVNQTTEELKIASNAQNAFSYIAGAFYSDSTVNQYSYRNWTLNPLAQDNISTTQNYAIYARATEKFSDFLSVVGGLRYNWDKVGWTINQFFDPANGIYGSGGYGQGGFGWNLSHSSSALVGDFAVQLHPSRDVMTYASYTRGYKPSAYNTDHQFATAQNAAGASDLAASKPAASEHIDSFELGMKSTLLDRHLTFNVDAFYTKYSGYQAQLYDNSTGLIANLVLSNADAETKGLEADLTYVKGNTRANLSAAYIDAKFTNFTNGVCYPGQTAAQGCVTTNGTSSQNLTGASLPDSPKLKLTASVTQTIPLDRFNLLLGTNLSYRSSTLMQADQNPQANQPGFALVDMSLGFQSKDERATLTAFVNNLTNHFYYSNMEDFFASATNGNYVIGQPARDAKRYFGVRFAYKY